MPRKREDPGHNPYGTGMTYDADTNALFERVLETLNMAAGDAAMFENLLAGFPAETRAMALIHILLMADAGLASTFAPGDLAQRDSALAGRAALTLARIADRREAESDTEFRPVRLGDMGLASHPG